LPGGHISRDLPASPAVSAAAVSHLDSKPPNSVHDIGNGILCAAIVLAALLAARPFAEMGFIDDWAYIRMAQLYASTGHFVYNGWETAMLGWQIPWGAWFIHLFGFSFTAVRLSTVSLVPASIAFFHASLRRFGISPRSSFAGTLMLGLSPLFLPLAATYMTDVPGLFCILLCLYLCQRALAAETHASALLWLASATASNLALGTVRQIVWLGALVMVPSTAWLLRHRPKLVITAALFWIASLVSVFACMQWFGQQPYMLPEKLYQGPISVHMFAHMLTELLKSVLCLTLLLLPLSAAWLGRARALPRSALLRIATSLLVLTAGAVPLALHGSLDHRVMPWLGHILGTQSIFSSTGEMLGTRPVTLTLPLRSALSLLVIAAALVCAEFLRRTSNTSHRKASSNFNVLCGPFIVAYILLLLPRATYSFIYDRYLLVVLPFAIAGLLLAYENSFGDRLPHLSTATLVLFGTYTLAGTHDWFALNRARIAAVSSIESSGVARTDIQGGFDYDGWTQLQAAGYVNDARIARPARAYRQVQSTLPPLCTLPFSSYTPAIHPRYFVVFHQMPCLAISSFAPILYNTWLPPFHRAVYIQQLSESPKD
jgi:hypothetical protein